MMETPLERENRERRERAAVRPPDPAAEALKRATKGTKPERKAAKRTAKELRDQRLAAQGFLRDSLAFDAKAAEAEKHARAAGMSVAEYRRAAQANSEDAFRKYVELSAPEQRSGTGVTKVQPREPEDPYANGKASQIDDLVQMRTVGMGSTGYVGDTRDGSMVVHPHGQVMTKRQEEAVRRLARHEQRQLWLYDHDHEAHVRIGQQLRCLAMREGYEGESEVNRRVQRVTDEIRFAGPEYRDVTTGGMAFTPNQYFLTYWSPAHTAAQVIAKAGRQLSLPAYGMEVDVPVLTQATGVAKQSAENTVIGNTDPVATFAKAPVGTYGTTVVASQQMYDRMGPGVTLDQVIAVQAGEESATQFDVQVATTVAASAGIKITNSGAASSGYVHLWGDASNAAQQIQTASGVKLMPNRVFVPSALARFYFSQLDNQQRPVWSPSAPTPVGDDADVSQRGFSGYEVAGMQLWYGDNNPLSGSAGATVIIGALPQSLLTYTSWPMIHVYPETFAAQLSVIVQVYSYMAFSVVYPYGFATLTGTAYPFAPTFGS